MSKAKARWEWSKRYRVWNATRKAFLYPENWIEPELRLSPAPRAALRKMVAFVSPARKKGFGILLTGKSRTGALAAAQTLAYDLSENLYRIDLSAIVSKYIGETEKNLSRVFDSVRKSGAILFFDEADALFGRRTEVKDSHDRYANYLLQRIEKRDGLTILATSRRDDVDKPFLRRIRFVISIPVGRKTRRKPSPPEVK